MKTISIREELAPTILKMREMALILRERPYRDGTDLLIDGLADEIEDALNEYAGVCRMPDVSRATDVPHKVKQNPRMNRFRPAIA